MVTKAVVFNPAVLFLIARLCFLGLLRRLFRYATLDVLLTSRSSPNLEQKRCAAARVRHAGHQACPERLTWAASLLVVRCLGFASRFAAPRREYPQSLPQSSDGLRLPPPC